ncbi:hypothetical protein [Nocardia sp. CA-290969]|uniref:hypothetical protein n=1 Tax=Nocardia sp. CA-290969 TaxID=3239986 RepID=UPI003D8AFBFE
MSEPHSAHVGRSWSGTAIEDSCPCPQEPCGLVDQKRAHPDCEHHPMVRTKTIRQSHTADRCPGPIAERVEAGLDRAARAAALSPLETALTEAIAFAQAHGFDEDPAPTDFGIQRSPVGVTLATYVGAGHVIRAIVTRGGAKFAVGEIEWVHDAADEARELCDYCELEEPGAFVSPPMTDVYLPGDAPAAADVLARGSR